ncbi:hypothetical protein [Nocardia thailandica]|uniref:hypothetical protein n=1 Tax=Nocardia thailandica TaxID=257275 RepID=UPI0012F9D4D8|nr:hypothetical protein [Nocardia thailandica]
MDTSDIIATVAAVLAFGSACVSAWALKYARSQAETAKKALAAAERAATAGEKSAESADKAAGEAQRSADAAEESNRIAARALELSEPPAVAWQIESTPSGTYYLRNVGTREATGVTADSSRTPARRHALPENVTVAAGDAVRFMTSNPPASLFLTWDGQTEPVAVPMPPPLASNGPRGIAPRHRNDLPPFTFGGQ